MGAPDAGQVNAKNDFLGIELAHSSSKSETSNMVISRTAWRTFFLICNVKFY